MAVKPYFLTLLLNRDLAITPELAARQAFLLVRLLDSKAYNHLDEVGDVEVIRVNTFVFHRLVSHAVMDGDWVVVAPVDGEDTPAIASIGPSTGRNAAMEAAIKEADRRPAKTSFPAAYFTVAAHDVLAERARQTHDEGYTSEHDDEHDAGELAEAALYYAADAVGHAAPAPWPWGAETAPSQQNRRVGLVKAAALLIAEIERLDRAAP